MKNRKYARIDAIILDLVEKEEGTISSYSLCMEYQISERTIRNEIQEIRKILEIYHLSLRKYKGTNYYIERDSEEAKQNLIKLSEDIHKRYVHISYETPNARVMFLLRKLVLSTEYLRLTDLADEMFISRSTISMDMKVVKEKLAEYELRIHNKPHYGICVEGPEEKIRECILDYGFIDQHIFSPMESLGIWSTILQDEDYEKVERVIQGNINHEYLKIHGFFLNNLIMHVFLSVKRIQANCLVQKNVVTFKKRYIREKELANRIANAIEQEFQIEYNENERTYLFVHLIGKQREDGKEETKEELYYLCERMIADASNLYNFDFQQDGSLRYDLYIHLKSVESRLDVGTKLRNPLLFEIKSKYPLAFEIAISCVKNEWNWLNSMSEDEIGYIAVHFAAALERMQKNHHTIKKNVLLISTSGVGTTRLMEVKLRHYFHDSINLILRESVYGIDHIYMDAYDLILTTTPISEKRENLLLIHAIPSNDELLQIEKILFQNHHELFSIGNMFHKDLFIIKEHAEKESLLKEICDCLYAKGIVEKEFYQGVMEREKCCTTGVGNHVALPHSIRPYAIQSSIYTCIVKKPMLWEYEEVQVIFLLAVKTGDAQYFANTYDLIVQIVEDHELVGKIISCNTYEEFMAIINKSRLEMTEDSFI